MAYGQVTAVAYLRRNVRYASSACRVEKEDSNGIAKDSTSLSMQLKAAETIPSIDDKLMKHVEHSGCQQRGAALMDIPWPEVRAQAW